MLTTFDTAAPSQRPEASRSSGRSGTRAPNHLNALRAFEAAARHASYVRAAAELHVTPAAVSQLVRSLEAVLGVSLFHRTQSGPSRLELTDDARAALPDLQAGFDLLRLAAARLKGEAMREMLALGVAPMFADTWLMLRLDRFRALHPQWDLRLARMAHAPRTAREGSFQAEPVDVGIRYGAGHWPGLAAQWMMGEDIFPVCSPALLAQAPGLSGTMDLRHHRLIHDASAHGDAALPSWHSWLRQDGAGSNVLAQIDMQSGLQVLDAAGAMQAALAGAGVALGRSVLVERELAAGRLVRPFGAAQVSAYSYYIVRQADLEPGEAVLALTAWLLDEARRD